jgi:hypothetical protein
MIASPLERKVRDLEKAAAGPLRELYEKEVREAARAIRPTRRQTEYDPLLDLLSQHFLICGGAAANAVVLMCSRNVDKALLEASVLGDGEPSLEIVALLAMRYDVQSRLFPVHVYERYDYDHEASQRQEDGV